MKQGEGRLLRSSTSGGKLVSEEQIRLFLEDLSKLTRKHGIKIGGCGCCGSPFLIELDDVARSEAYSYRIKDDEDLKWEPKEEANARR